MTIESPLKLLIATHNPHKLREYRELLTGLPLTLVTLDGVGVTEEIEETGTTIEENARLKAANYSRAAGLVALADDSGLEVDALGGEPGVYSKRYAGEGKSDTDRCRFLLQKLAGTPLGRRKARFRCVIAITLPGGKTYASEGTCAGQIGFELRGTGGFGYDPLFIMNDDPAGRTMAELDEAEKNSLSHRARAAVAARPILKALIAGKEPPASPQSA